MGDKSSQGLYKVFVNSDYRNKSFEKSSDFTFYVDPPLTGVSSMKVNSVSVPMSQFTFAGKTEEQRTFLAYPVQTAHSSRHVNIVFETGRNYTRTDFVAILNEGFEKASIDVTVRADAHSGTAVEFVSDETYPVVIAKFPVMKQTMPVPSNIPVAGGTFTSDNNYIRYETQVQRSLPNISELVYTETDEHGTITEVPLALNANTYSVGSLVIALVGQYGAFGTWTVTGVDSKAIISCAYTSEALERKVKLQVRDLTGNVVTSNKLNLKGDEKTIPAYSSAAFSFSVDAVLTPEYVFLSNFNTVALPTFSFDAGNIYTVAEFVADINAQYGSTLASVVSTNVYRLTNPSSTAKIRLIKNTAAGILTSQEIAVSSSADFTLTDFSVTGTPLNTGSLDFGSGVSKVSYISLPNLVTTSRCGSGHRSICTSIMNQSTEIYGSYATRVDDSEAYHTTNVNEISEIQVKLLDENHNVADIGELPLFLELVFK